MSPSKSLTIALLTLLLSLTTLLAAAPVDPAIDNPMAADPDLTQVEPPRIFSPRLAKLWLEALEQPDAWTRQQALEAFASAHEKGMPQVPALAERFSAELSRPQQHPLVKLEAARTLVRIEARDAAPALLTAARDGEPDLVLLVDAALARWDHAPAREGWMQRLADADASDMLRRSAAEALGQVRHPAAAAPLRELALNAQATPTLRLAAAAALGRIVESGLEPDVNALLARQTLVDRLVAANLLAAHSAPASIDLLGKLAQDGEPAVAAIAVRRLLAVQPGKLAGLAPNLIKSPDANLRSLVLQHDREHPSAHGIARLGLLLGDDDFNLRRSARAALLELAPHEAWSDAVQRLAAAALVHNDWRQQEQAALLLGLLKHSASADALLTLLEHERHEVRLAAIVSLRRIARTDTLGALLRHAERLAAGPLRPLPPLPPEPAGKDGKKPTPMEIEQHKKLTGQIIDAQARQRLDQARELQHLLQVFAPGDVEAAPLLRKFVPKSAGQATEARAAAIWVLGHLHRDQPDAALVRELTARLNDTQGMEPEIDEVRAQSAVALGRMKAKAAAATLKSNHDLASGAGMVGDACAWALRQLGEPVPPRPDAPPATSTGWFLEPIE